MAKRNKHLRKEKEIIRGFETGKEPAPNKVKMVFKEHKYYRDLSKPVFLAGQVYELEGAEWIVRWLKRGGIIVEGYYELPEQEEVPVSRVTNVGSDEQEGDKDLETGESGKASEDELEPEDFDIL